MVWHFSKVFEGYLTLMVAPLPRHYLATIPVKDQVNGAGLPPGRDRQAAGLRARSSSSPSRPRPSSASCATTTTRTRARGKPANLDSVVFKWYGDPDAMIAGFRGGEIDVAFDLQDSTSRRSRTSATRSAPSRPSCTSSCARTGRPDRLRRRPTTNTGGCSRNPAVQDRGTGCPMADPAIRQAHRLRDRQERDQHPPPRRQRPGREHQHQPGGVVLRGPDRRRPSTRRRPSRSSTTAAGLTPTATASSRRTASRPRSSSARPPARSARTRSPSISAWLKDVGIDSVINPVVAGRHLRRLQRGHERHPVRPVAQQLRPRRARVQLVDRPAGQLLQLPQQPVPTRTAPTTPRSTTRTSTRRSTPSRTTWTSRSIKDAMATFQKVYVDKTVEIPLYYRKNVELAGPRARQLLRQRHPGRLDLERRGLVRHAVGPDPRRRATERGARIAGRPVRAAQRTRSRRGCTVRATSGRSGRYRPASTPPHLRAEAERR